MEGILFEIFEALPRQGPGDYESTKRALQKVGNLPENPNILDVGCGVGMQTVDLAKLTKGQITAVDNHAPFLTQLQKKAEEQHCQNQIKTVQADMMAMDFPPDSFDLIWSEGAVYIMGFDKALHNWKPMLHPFGSVVLSEIAWFKPNPPQEAQDFWSVEYPSMKYFEDYVAMLEVANYELLESFRLPAQSWWTDYYQPMETKLVEMRAKYHNDLAAQELFGALQLEIDIHRKYSDFYGYVFYVMRTK